MSDALVDPDGEEPGVFEDVPVLDESMLPEVVAELSGQMHRLDDHVAAHDEHLRALHESFEALENSLTEKVNLARPNRWAWEFLTREQATQLWAETRWFADYLIRRYPLPSEVSIPPCWYRHSVAVDELSDVYAAWREAYCSGDRPSTAMTAWRDRWLWPMLHRLASYADWRECKERRRHVDPTARQQSTDDEFADFVTADVETRPEKTPMVLPWPTKRGKPRAHAADSAP
ncbi:hypothetical protein [Alloactinosynnema sp. L-07]|uniref:hypothetical protein n=1 Tax=Alloactinosynnema sp. L-07 TaxID=1653480 RepID=UPI00065EF3B0|nr:hypothetical protein [Alloactinosynnema sp. L-07]CRK56993.1 hypothetical protein [Alloactinosynnema sp. L-07]